MPTLPVDELHAAITKAQGRWTAADNDVTKRSDEARAMLLGVVVDHGDVAAAMARPAVGAPPARLPAAVGWRNYNGQNYVTPIEDQGNCGSCVSFRTVATLESTVLIKFSVTLDLSEADSHFCSSHGANCGGWWPSAALDQMKARGVCD